MDTPPQTPWQIASEALGTTDSERYLGKLAKRAFLSLWSYTNLYRDEGLSANGVGQELCDLLVVFGDHVLIFSDKHCDFPQHPDINVSWKRWYKKAIEKSVKQLAGAEKWLRERPGRVFLDAKCTASFPFSIPSSDKAKYHLIAVTRGSHEAARKYFGGGSSGSYMLDTYVQEASHYETPFRIGWPLPDKRFVHVFDEMALDVVLDELDTISDLVAYLETKATYLSQPGVLFQVPGEEQLVARYVLESLRGQRGFPPVPNGFDSVIFPEGEWEAYGRSPQRKAKRIEDEISYEWDRLIEYQSSFIKAGTAISHEYLPAESPFSHERVARALAEESRFSRRQLAHSLYHALSVNEPGKRFARTLLSEASPRRAYIFLTAPKPTDATYERYREIRTQMLVAYCDASKLKYPHIEEAIGIASEPMTEQIASQDFLYIEYGEEPLDPENRAEIEETLSEMGLWKPETMSWNEGQDHEFPVPFSFGPPSHGYSMDPGQLNRAQRRAHAKKLKKASRKK